MNKLKKLGLILLSSVFVLAACGTSGSGTEKVLRVADANKPITLNHHDTSIAADFNQIGQMMETLVEYDLDKKMIPAAAESWTESDDHLTYTFKIRKDAKWSNGDDLTANDFVFAWKQLATTTTSPYSSYVSILKNGEKVHAGELDKDQLGVSATDDKTLVVELEKPSALFLSNMAFSIFAPMNEKFFNEVGGFEAYGKSADTVVGNGAYKVETFTAETEVIFVKNENYWDNKNVDVDRVEFRVVTEPATQSAMFENGEIDVLDVRSTLVDQYKDYENLVPYMEAGNNYIYLSNETQKEMPALGNKNFRLAIAYALDKTVFTDQIRKDGSKPLNSIVPYEFGAVGDSFYSDLFEKEISADVPSYDLAKATEHFNLAKNELGDTPLEFTFNFAETATNKLIYENFKSQLESALPGIKVNLNYIPSQLFYPEVKAFEVPAAAAGWGADFFDYATFFELITPGGSYNYGRYANDEIGKLIEQAESEPAVSNPEQRAALYLQAEKIALQDARIIPILQGGASYAVKPNIKNYQRGALSPHVAYKYVTMS